MPQDNQTIIDLLSKSPEEMSTSEAAIVKALKGLSSAYSDMEKDIKGPTKATRDLAAAQREAASTFESFGDSMAGMVGQGSGLNKTIQNMVKSAALGKDAFSGLTTSLKKNFSIMSIGVSVMEKMFEATSKLVTNTDAAFVSFQKSTGAISTYGSKISALESELYIYGITMDDAAASQGSLVTGMKNFDKLSSGAQKDLLKTTSILDKMGVDSGITTANLNFMTNSMGMIPEAAASAARSMMSLAKELETPPEAMAAAFKEAQPQLAAFGLRADAVFQKLARNAHEANMEISDMLRITEQFDKFDTAASAVGKLNSALGGPYLSTMRMVTTTDPTDRMRMMSDAARQAGKSFNSMEHYERKMIASAMGLKDVNELALVMAGEFDLAGGAVEMTTEKIIEQEKGLRDYNTIAEEWNQIMRTFAVDIAGPVIYGLKSMMESLQNLGSAPWAWIAAGIGLITVAIFALMAATGPVGVTIGFVIGLIAGIAVLAKGLYDLVGGADTFNKIIEKVKSKTEGFGGIIERISASYAKLYENLTSTGGSMSEFLPTIDTFIDFSVRLIGGLLKMGLAFAKILEYISSSTTAMIILAAVTSPLWASFAFVGAAISVLAGIIVGLIYVLSELFHMIFVGNSPSIIEVFGMLGNAISAVGNAFLYPIQMVGKMMSVLKDLAGLLAGKALSFLSGAMSYVFGTSTESQVSNSSFDRGADMDREAVSIGEEVAKAVKAALENTQLNNKVQLEIKSDRGLPSLFDYIVKGVDDSQSGHPVNHALNASRAGLG